MRNFLASLLMEIRTFLKLDANKQIICLRPVKCDRLYPPGRRRHY